MWIFVALEASPSFSFSLSLFSLAFRSCLADDYHTHFARMCLHVLQCDVHVLLNSRSIYVAGGRRGKVTAMANATINVPSFHPRYSMLLSRSPLIFLSFLLTIQYFILFFLDNVSFPFFSFIKSPLQIRHYCRAFTIYAAFLFSFKCRHGFFLLFHAHADFLVMSPQNPSLNIFLQILDPFSSFTSSCKL